MKAAQYFTLAAAAAGALGLASCRSKGEKEQHSKSAGDSPRSRSAAAREEAMAMRDGEKDPSTSPKLAMNRNAETTQLLGRSKPAWLTLAKPRSATMSPGREDAIAWRELSDGQSIFPSGQTVRTVGAIVLPDALSSRAWGSASLSPDGLRLLMVPLDMTESASVFRVTGDRLDEPSHGEVPVVNFDDSRRWFIEWQGWISDSQIIGIFNETDLAGHIIVRTGIYLYDLDTRSLQRVELPTGVYAADDPYLEIVSVSAGALVVGTRDGEKTISLK